MKENHSAKPGGRLKSLPLRFGFLILLAGTGLVLSMSANAAPPPVGAVIANQATATYKDAGGSDQTATSNVVTTTVQQVGSYTLVTNNTKYAAPGTTVYMPHTITNTGNGSDSFTITLPAPPFDADLNGVAIYADNNADGMPDSTTPLCTVGGTPNCVTGITTGSLAADGKFNFIVAMDVKATAADAATATEVVTAEPLTPALYAVATLSNTDTLNVTTTLPVFSMTKEIINGPTSGPAGTTVTYKLTYTNTGNAAGPLYIKDVIGTGATASYKYVPGSALWSGSGTTALTDVAGETATGILYGANTIGTAPNAVTTIEALIANVDKNSTGSLTFQVLVETGAPLGSSETTNKANYGDGTGVVCTAVPCTNTPANIPPTNESPFIVTGAYGVVANDWGTDMTDTTTITGHNLVDKTDHPATLTSAAPGTVVVFEDYIWNNGQATDSFKITYDNSTFTLGAGMNYFPLGTTFQLFKEDGSTPLATAETPPIPAKASYKVVVKATIPANACAVIDCTSATANKDFTMQVTATSKGDPSLSNEVYNQLGEITPPKVDLTNNLGVDGKLLGYTPATGAILTPGTPITSVIVVPGKAARFKLGVENGGAAVDNFNLMSHVVLSPGLTNISGFKDGTVPPGWSVMIHQGDCPALATDSITGAVVKNTGPITPGVANRADFCAEVVTPASATNTTPYYVYFMVESIATGAKDIKLDSVTLDPSIGSLTLMPDHSGQIQPGGTIVYPHTLANNGATSCAGVFKFDVVNTTGWNYAFYFDKDKSGTINAGDEIIASGTTGTTTPATSTIPALAAGAEAKLLVKVQAPAGAQSGSNNVITLKATDTAATGSCGSSQVATDTTNVLIGQIRLVKTQALADWDGTAGSCKAPIGSYTGSGTVLQQKPGQCIWYKVVATNEGDAAVSNVKINDGTPTYTTYGGGGACTAGATFSAGLTIGSTGSANCATWATVAPNASVEMDFSVRVNP